MARARDIAGQVTTLKQELKERYQTEKNIVGVFREGIFTHSGIRWGVALLGWRTIFGGTVYGWHDRVKIQARTCLAAPPSQPLPTG